MSQFAKWPAIVLSSLLLSACVGGGLSSGGGGPFAGAQATEELVTPSWRVASVAVSVPETLTVSEANSIKPRADLVWHGDPLGDRHAQIRAVMLDGLRAGAATLSGSQPVQVEVVVTRFHAQTPKVRYGFDFGSEHEIEFLLTVRDAASGALLVDARPVDATFDAYSGMAAVRADQEGNGQKVRIRGRLAQVIAEELTRPQALFAPADDAG